MSTSSADLSDVNWQHVVLEDVSWDFYERLLEEVRNRPGRMTYRPHSSSAVFPFLPIDRFNQFLKSFKTEEHNAVVRAFREWVIHLP